MKKAGILVGVEGGPGGWDSDQNPSVMWGKVKLVVCEFKYPFEYSQNALESRAWK